VRPNIVLVPFLALDLSQPAAVLAVANCDRELADGDGRGSAGGESDGGIFCLAGVVDIAGWTAGFAHRL
jgi:hypothetical protein